MAVLLEYLTVLLEMFQWFDGEGGHMSASQLDPPLSCFQPKMGFNVPVHFPDYC